MKRLGIDVLSKNEKPPNLRGTGLGFSSVLMSSDPIVKWPGLEVKGFKFSTAESKITLRSKNPHAQACELIHWRIGNYEDNRSLTLKWWRI